MRSDFRSDESFPVKTGSRRREMVDTSFEPEYPGLPGKMTLFLSPEAYFWFYRQKTGKTGNYQKVLDIPLIRRAIIDFLMTVLATLPKKCQLPVLFPKNR